MYARDVNRLLRDLERRSQDEYRSALSDAWRQQQNYDAARWHRERDMYAACLVAASRGRDFCPILV